MELEKIPEDELSPEDVLERKERMKIIEKEIDDLQKKKSSVEGKVEMYQEIDNNILELSEEAEYLNKKLQSLYLQRDAIKVARDVLEEATRNIQAIAVPDIVNKASTLFSKITSGRYLKLAMDEEMNIVLTKKDSENILSMVDLSSGTADQLYFALRMSTANLICQNKKPPFILDDSLIYFDKERLAKTKEILDELSKDYQIILFSHNPIFADWSSSVIRLSI